MFTVEQFLGQECNNIDSMGIETVLSRAVSLPQSFASSRRGWWIVRNLLHFCSYHFSKKCILMYFDTLLLYCISRLETNLLYFAIVAVFHNSAPLESQNFAKFRFKKIKSWFWRNFQKKCKTSIFSKILTNFWKFWTNFSKKLRSERYKSVQIL